MTLSINHSVPVSTFLTRTNLEQGTKNHRVKQAPPTQNAVLLTALSFFGESEVNKETYKKTMEEVLALWDSGDVHFKKWDYENSNKYYESAIAKLVGLAGADDSGGHTHSNSLKELRRKLRYSKLAAPLGVRQNAVFKGYAEISPERWDRRDPQYSKMLKEHEALNRDKNVLESLASKVLGETDESKAESIINATAQGELADVEQRLEALKQYQNSPTNNSYAAEQARALRSTVDSLSKKSDPSASELGSTIENVNNSALTDAEKNKAMTDLAEKSLRQAGKALSGNDLVKTRDFLDQANNAMYYVDGNPKLRKEIDQLGLKLLGKELPSKITHIKNLMLNLNSLDKLNELVRNFTGLLVAFDDNSQYKDKFVHQQSGLKSFSPGYFAAMFDPFNTEYEVSGSPYYENWYEQNSKGQVTILEAPSKGYTATQLRRLIRQNPQMPEIEALDDLLYDLSVFFYDPVLGGISAINQQGKSNDNTRFAAQLSIYGLTDLLVANPQLCGYGANELRDQFNKLFTADELDELESKFGSFKNLDYSNNAQVVALYLMAMDPTIQADGRIYGIFEHEWDNDGTDRLHVSKKVNRIISESQLKGQYKKQLQGLKHFYSLKKSEAGRPLQIKLIDFLMGNVK